MLKKIINRILGIKRPTIFMVETVLGCNLHCPECAIGGDLISRPKGVLSFENFKIIADKIAPYAKYVYLFIWGEPLLNKDIFSMIEYTSRFARTSISTNGMLVTEEIADKLVAAGVSDIIVSIDGTTQEIYEQYRVGGELEKALAALTYINNAKMKLHSKVHIHPQFCVFKHNQHQMNEFEKICNAINLKPEFKAPYIRANSQYENSDIAKYTRESFTNKDDYEKVLSKCTAFNDALTINLDGSVVICCYDSSQQLVLGNIYDSNVKKIYNNAQYTAIRNNAKEASPPEFCIKNCLAYTYKTPS